MHADAVRDDFGRLFGRFGKFEDTVVSGTEGLEKVGKGELFKCAINRY